MESRSAIRMQSGLFLLLATVAVATANVDIGLESISRDATINRAKQIFASMDAAEFTSHMADIRQQRFLQTTSKMRMRSTLRGGPLEPENFPGLSKFSEQAVTANAEDSAGAAPAAPEAAPAAAAPAPAPGAAATVAAASGASGAAAPAPAPGAAPAPAPGAAPEESQELETEEEGGEDELEGASGGAADAACPNCLLKKDPSIGCIKTAEEAMECEKNAFAMKMTEAKLATCEAKVAAKDAALQSATKMRLRRMRLLPKRFLMLQMKQRMPRHLLLAKPM